MAEMAFQWFSDASDGRLNTLLDCLKYTARLVPHIEEETLSDHDHKAAAATFGAIYDAFDAIDPSIRIEGCKRLVHSKNPPPDMVRDLARAPAIQEIVSHLELLEKHCSKAKAVFDFQQQTRLAWVPKLEYRPR